MILKLAFSILIFTATNFAAAQKADNSIPSITEALRSQRYDQALEMARSSLQKTPGDPKILTLEGLAFSGLGKKKEALTAYNAALKIAPKYVPALEGAAQIEYNDGSDRALPLLNRLLSIKPDDPTTHAMLAAIAYGHHDCASAVKHFQASAAALSSHDHDRFPGKNRGQSVVIMKEGGQPGRRGRAAALLPVAGSPAGPGACRAAPVAPPARAALLAQDDQRHDGRDQQDDHERPDCGYVPEGQAGAPDQAPDEQVHDQAPDPATAAEAAQARSAACGHSVRVGGQNIAVTRQAVRLRRCAGEQLAGVGNSVSLHQSTMPPAWRACAIAWPPERMDPVSMA